MLSKMVSLVILTADDESNSFVYGNSDAYAYGDGVDFDVDDSDSFALAH